MQKKQAVLELSPNRKLKLCNKPVLGEWLVEEKKQKAWHCLPKLYTWFGLVKGGLGLVIDNRFSIPINPYAKYEKEELEALTNLDKKKALSLSLAIGTAEKEGAQNILALGLVAIVSMIVLVVIVLALLVASGRI